MAGRCARRWRPFWPRFLLSTPRASYTASSALSPIDDPSPSAVGTSADAADNEYLALYGQRMEDLRGLGWEPDRLKQGPISSAGSGLKELNPLIAPYLELQVAPLRRLFAWVVPNEEALQAVAQVSPCGIVEIGAGTGYWAWLLRRRGVNVVAFDREPLDALDMNGHHALARRLLQSPAAGGGRESSRLPQYVNPPPFTEVQEGGPEMAAKHPDKTLLLCWPPMEHRTQGAGETGPGESTPEQVMFMAADTLERYNGSTVVYVGDVPGPNVLDAKGQTAGPRFHEALASEWQCSDAVALPCWPGTQPQLTVWKRIQESGQSAKRGSQKEDSAMVDKSTEVKDRAKEFRRSLLTRCDQLWSGLVMTKLLQGQLGRPLGRVEESALQRSKLQAPWWIRWTISSILATHKLLK